MKKNRIFNAVVILGASVVVFVILAALQYIGVIDEYNGQLLTLSGIYIVVALSLNLITGFTGQLALGQAGFMSVGAYTTAIAIMKFHVPMLLAILIGGLVAAVFGIIIGFPTLRLRGDYLAIATLGFGEIIRVLMINLGSLTGGAAGLKGIPAFSETENFVLDAVIKFSWVYVFAVITIVIISNLINSSPGRAIISIREDEIAANSMGINIAYYKIFSFTLSAFLAGVGGGLYGIYMGYLNPTMFGFMPSMNIVVIVVLGGLGSITGTVVASVAFTYIQEWLRVFKDLRLVIFGLALILVMIFWPKGLLGNKELSISGFLRKLFKRENNPERTVSQQNGSREGK
ncbi:MAG: branched-chain amino acid ABC transporter permease [Clostridiales bacterium]|jgi:branched-chain amino acid transport system permease protein|nr:branched-chain amino acid ABC transporter permease [Eubacteriales bacterium]MDH7565196.1 branched-chain amino acid ABC transporter permease [Clostridiales bacterium]